MMEMNIRGGVLIIGSLWWQDHLEIRGDDRRKNWRRDYLDTAAAVRVRVPIRYGRLSGGTLYTMTFANSVRETPGTGIVSPFRSHPVNDEETLKREALAISTAEGMEARFIGGVRRPWSVLAILLNPKLLDEKKQQKLLQWWPAQLQREQGFRNFAPDNFRHGDEEPCILQNGSLNIPWPTTVAPESQAALDQYDFLLATATLPTELDYPDSAMMRSNAEADSNRNYFLNNYIHGIHTFQDEEILAGSESLQQRLAILKAREMTLENIKSKIEAQFGEISAALFGGSINYEEIEATERVFAEASPMFSANILRYSPTNFRYFYRLEKYLCNVVDLVNLKVLVRKLPKLKVDVDILTLTFSEQCAAYEDKDVPSHAQFLEYNFILDLFVFLHECGHLNQTVTEGEEGTATNHFAEYNADYFALTKILLFYNSMKTAQPGAYGSRVQIFGSEQHLIRLVIVKALTVIYLGVLPDLASPDTETHPAIRKRFCYLLVQVAQQLNDNFQSLFVSDNLKDFLVEIFQTMHFLEHVLFETKKPVFDNLSSCIADLETIQQDLNNHSSFDSFNK
jgi:hypothetical protein